MKNQIILIIIFFTYSIVLGQGNVINVPDDQPTIQAAINASVDGDTVLVADGTYFENIYFKGKAVTLASHFLVDGDDSHVDNTIIDGSQATNPDSGSVVYFISGEDTTSVLYGFTVTGGKGTIDPHNMDILGGGGIIIHEAGAKIQFNKIAGNEINYKTCVGGGLVIDSPSNDVLVVNNVISDNRLIPTGAPNYGEGGGGILIYKCLYQSVIIANNVIANNVVSKTDGSLTGGGGGIFLNLSKALLKNNLIKNNKAYYGGGVEYNSFRRSTEFLFINNTVVNNEAVKGGGYCGVDAENLPQIYNSIFWGNTASTSPQFYYAPIIRYSNVQGGRDGAGNIDLDPMFADTVNYNLDPSSPCVDAGAPYLLCSDIEDPLNPNVPLSPSFGNLRNDMGAYGGNLQTLSSKVDRTVHVPKIVSKIQNAIEASQNGDTVLVADGTYFENINFKGKAVTLTSHFLVDGDDSHVDNTVIDGSQPENPDMCTVVEFNSGEDTTSVLYGFTITGGTGQPDPYGYGTRGAGGIGIDFSGAKIQYNKITGNVLTHNANVEGGGIVINANSNDVLILDNYITNNEVLSSVSNGEGGGGIIIYKCLNGVKIANNVIANNVVSKTDGSPTGGGGGILLKSSKALLRNNLIKNNKAYYGGGLEFDDFPGSTELLFINNTVVNNEAVKGGGYCGVDAEKLPKIYNSIFWGNTASTSPQFYYAPVIRYSNVQGGREGEGNIDQDPMFADTLNFYLDPSSPCVDSGCPWDCFKDLEDHANLGNPLFPSLGGMRNDMGHTGGNPMSVITDVKLVNSSFPDKFYLSQNYPNPFNPSTTIKYQLPAKVKSEKANVKLIVFDILGKNVATLVNEKQRPGNYQINWDAGNQPSGVYFYSLTSGKFKQTKKMLLVK